MGEITIITVGSPAWSEEMVKQGLNIADQMILAGEILNERRREARTKAETDGFTHLVGEQAYRIDSDRDSILRIANAATGAISAMMGSQSWGTVWACADGQALPVDAQGMLAVQASLAYHGQLCHNRSQEIQAAIQGAQTLAELDAIGQSIGQGWPE